MLCKMEFYKFLYWTWTLNLNSVKQQLRQQWVRSKTLSSVYTIQPVVKPVVKLVSQPVEQTVAVRSTGCQPPVQPVVKPVVRPVWQPVWQPAVSCKQTSNCLSNRFDKPVGCLFTRHSRLSNRLHNRFENRLYSVKGVLCDRSTPSTRPVLFSPAVQVESSPIDLLRCFPSGLKQFGSNHALNTLLCTGCMILISVVALSFNCVRSHDIIRRLRLFLMQTELSTFLPPFRACREIEHAKKA